ncbi:hypothetical protein Tco_0924188 [Tanacetum coccineum]|uniref:CCHC-type domain-containing protein n=1 Tax=Tanacetum coccineum TaxID=301880 RepID=A0ABQ5D476_9ASTR
MEKMENVIDNSGCAENQEVKYDASLFVNKALTWRNTQVQARGREAAIDQFHELAKLVPHLVTPESSRIKRYIDGLAPEIRGMLQATQPTTIQSAILRAGILTDESVSKRFVAATPHGNRYTSPHSKCAKCWTIHPEGGPCQVCYNCQKLGHFAMNYRMLIKQVTPINVVRGNCWDLKEFKMILRVTTAQVRILQKISRKRSKPDKHGHGKGKRIQEPGECYQSSKQSQPSIFICASLISSWSLDELWEMEDCQSGKVGGIRVLVERGKGYYPLGNMGLAGTSDAMHNTSQPFEFLLNRILVGISAPALRLLKPNALMKPRWSDPNVFTMKMEILLEPASNKHLIYALSGKPIQGDSLNLPDSTCTNRANLSNGSFYFWQEVSDFVVDHNHPDGVKGLVDDLAKHGLRSELLVFVQEDASQ